MASPHSNNFTQRHSIFCILPPHVLHSIAQNGNQQQREVALRGLAIDNTLRAMRASAPRAEASAAKRPGPFVEEGAKRRTIYDARHTQELPGALVRAEGAPPTRDPAVDEAYEGLGDTFDLFWNVYGRHSIDDEGMRLDATVHFGQEYDNAFWNGERMVFGDGDGQLFNRFTISLDVIGHELTHGVTEDEAQLVYFYQAGALNESMSDVFGSLVKQYRLKQTAAQADWLIGAGLLTRNVKGVALRSMKAPGTAFDDPVLGKDPQPAHMRNFVRTFDDNGGVHINSGIPNHAFYQAATIITGNAWEKAGRIWYETLRDNRVRPNTGFQRFAQLTVATSVRLFGATSKEAQAVRQGWNLVGISVK